MPLGGDEANLTTWSDAGYGGIGTRAQTGILVTWGGAVILWRSSKQTFSALSSCEAEVAAAALTFQVLEGLRHLLTEWGVTVATPTLHVDNKSAIIEIDFTV